MVDIAKIADRANSITDVIAKVASFGQQALPVAQLVASLIPGGGIVVSAIGAALPYIQKAAAAAPAIQRSIAAGVPIAEAIQANGPDVVASLKEIFAIAVNHDPERKETTLKGSQVSMAEVATFAVPFVIGYKMTQAEENAYHDRFGIGSVS